MSTTTIGNHTFAILATSPVPLREAVAPALNATHFAKVYRGTRDYSGNRVIRAVSGGHSIPAGETDEVGIGLIQRIDRIRTTNTDVYGLAVDEETGEDTSNPHHFGLSVWNEPDFIPLYRLASTEAAADDCQWWNDDSYHPGHWSQLPDCRCGREAGAHHTNHPHDIAGFCDGYRRPGAPTPTPVEVPTVLPRTSDEAHRMLRLVEGVLADITPERDPEMSNALRTLRTFLPGGRAEREAKAMADRIDLCPQFEAIVVPTLGWTPRVGRGYAEQQAHFAALIEQAEREVSQNSVSATQALVRFAAHYQRGGVANRAIVDHMESHLEAHKWPAANEMLEALGMDGLEVERERDYRIGVRVRRTIEIEVEQYVTVPVRATNEDEAHDAIDEYLIADYADDYGWTDENGGTHYAHTGRHNIDTFDVEDVEVDA